MAADAPARLDIVIRKGGAFVKRIAVTNSDGTPRVLSGYTAKMQIRGDVDDVAAALTLADGSGLTITAGSGLIDINITKAQTAALVLTSGVWDLWIDNGGIDSPEYLAEGGVVIRKMVTQ